ncbi:MAG TPA: hypothetical protein DDW52_00565 [Planctomycetaceae bacterium]|nr:hypothetical protein [Planctomycetaceae bacterium]
MKLTVAIIFCVVLGISASAADPVHNHGTPQESKPKPPRVYLDKSPRVVQYQLGRLSNEQLLLIETDATDKKYAPVFSAILARSGMSPAERQNALAGLTAINDSTPVQEMVATIRSLKPSKPAERRSIESLAKLLLATSKSELLADQSTLESLVDGSSAQAASIGFAALVTAGLDERSQELAVEKRALPSLLDATRRIRSADDRNKLLEVARNSLASSSSTQGRVAAIRALGYIESGAAESFDKVSKLVEDEALRPAVFQSLLRIAPEKRAADASQRLAQWLVQYAETTPAAQRTEDSFLDAMQLVDQLLAKLPADQARPYRARLRETVVRVVRIHTVEEEMRYDTPYFAVEAGRPVQIVLVNEDLMPHNLVITREGALKEVADEGFAAGPDNGLDGKQYVPKSDQVLEATHMIPARETERLTFTAPEQPGEYPYVCTFPRHWMRMYGVMIVVEDLDAWNASPKKPTDPIGSNRAFVKAWTVDDLKDNLETGMKGRLPSIGKKLFEEATCASCHHAGDLKIGAVGPELDTLYQRWKSDRVGILREILDPSHKIDEKYAVEIVLTLDGDTISGLVVEDTKDTLSLLENPESTMPTKIAKDDIEDRVKSSNSMMPKGLLNQYSQDEIFEIMGYLETIQKDAP